MSANGSAIGGGQGPLLFAAQALNLAVTDWTTLGYAALALGTLAAVASAILAVSSRARGGTTSQAQAAADVRATISLLAESPERDAVPAELAQWETHAAEVARQQLNLSLKHSAIALRQSRRHQWRGV